MTASVDIHPMTEAYFDVRQLFVKKNNEANLSHWIESLKSIEKYLKKWNIKIC